MENINEVLKQTNINININYKINIILNKNDF